MEAPNCLPHSSNLYFCWKVFCWPCPKNNKCLIMPSLRFFQIPPPSQKKKQQMPIYTSKRVCLLIFLWSWMTRFRQKVPDIIPLCFQVGSPPKWPCENCSYRFTESSSPQLMALYWLQHPGVGYGCKEHRFNQVVVSSWWFFTTHLKNMLVELDHFP